MEPNKNPTHGLISKEARLDNLRKVIHKLNLDPLSYYEYEGYGYKLLFVNLNSYFSEINSILNDLERMEVERIKNIIDKFMVYHPVHKTIRGASYGEDKKYTQFNSDNWLELKKLLFQYQLKIFELDDKHSSKIDKKEGKEV